MALQLFAFHGRPHDFAATKADVPRITKDHLRSSQRDSAVDRICAPPSARLDRVVEHANKGYEALLRNQRAFGRYVRNGQAREVRANCRESSDGCWIGQG
jgi:hypothetical protein